MSQDASIASEPEPLGEAAGESIVSAYLYAEDVDSALEEPEALGFYFGPLFAQPRLGYQVDYTDNVFQQERNERSDIVHEIRPEIELRHGSLGPDSPLYVSASYQAEFEFYQRGVENDTTNHAANLLAGFQSGRHALNATAGYVSTSDLSLEEGGRIQRDILSTQGTYFFEATGKSQIELDFDRQSTRLNRRGLDSDITRAIGWWSYALSPKISTALGLGGGASSVAVGSDWRHSEASLRIDYQPTAKFSLRASAGVEIRDFSQSDLTQTGPIFDASAAYQPLDATSISLSGSRQVVPSNFSANQSLTNTRGALSVTQRFRQTYYLTVTAEIGSASFQSTSATGADQGTSDYHSLAITLRRDFGAKTTAEIYGSLRDRSTLTGSGGLSETRLGARVTYTF